MTQHHCTHQHSCGNHDHPKKADIPTQIAAGAEFATESVNNFLMVAPPIDVAMRLIFRKSRPVFLGFSQYGLPISISLAIIMALSEAYIHAHLNTNAQEEHRTLLPAIPHLNHTLNLIADLTENNTPENGTVYLGRQTDIEGTETTKIIYKTNLTNNQAIELNIKNNEALHVFLLNAIDNNNLSALDNRYKKVLLQLISNADHIAPEDKLTWTQTIALGLEWGGHASQFASFATFLLYLFTEKTMSDGLQLLLYSPIVALSAVASWATVRACIKEVRAHNFEQKGFEYPNNAITLANNTGRDSDNWTKTAIFFGVFQTFVANMLYFGQLIDLIFNGVAYDEKEVSVFHTSFYGLIVGGLISSFLTLGISYCELIFLIKNQPNYQPKSESSPSLNVYEKNSLIAYTVGGTAVIVEAINFVFHLMLHDVLNRWQSLLLTFALSVLAYPFMRANIRMYEESFKDYNNITKEISTETPAPEKTTLLSYGLTFFAITREKCCPSGTLRDSLLGWNERLSNF